MEQTINELVGGLILVSGLVAIAYFIARYTFLIKKMLIEKGIKKEQSGQGITKRDVAYVVVGLGVGLLITGGLSLLNLSEDTLDLVGWGVVLISGATGLLIASKSK
ncbi:hypothetical protein [Ekhidna sp.]